MKLRQELKSKPTSDAVATLESLYGSIEMNLGDDGIVTFNLFPKETIDNTIDRSMKIHMKKLAFDPGWVANTVAGCITNTRLDPPELRGMVAYAIRDIINQLDRDGMFDIWCVQLG